MDYLLQQSLSAQVDSEAIRVNIALEDQVPKEVRGDNVVVVL